MYLLTQGESSGPEKRYLLTQGESSGPEKRYLLTQGESSGPSVQPPKRKRGRPRKDQSLKSPDASASVGVKEHLPPKIRGPEPVILGQAVTGVVEAAFDSGYLLSVKIGNTKMRGIVFKPGHCVPIAAANDVAPHLPMIKRKNFRIPGKKRKTATPSKRKYEPPETAVKPSGFQIFNNGDGDVEMVEPLSILPPVQSVPVGQIFVDEIAPGMQQDDGKEALKSSAANGGITELLQAWQGDVNKDEVQITEESAYASQVEFDKMMSFEAANEGEAQICEESAFVSQAEFDEMMSTAANAGSIAGTSDEEWKLKEVKEK